MPAQVFTSPKFMLYFFFQKSGRQGDYLEFIGYLIGMGAGILTWCFSWNNEDNIDSRLFRFLLAVVLSGVLAFIYVNIDWNSLDELKRVPGYFRGMPSVIHRQPTKLKVWLLRWPLFSAGSLIIRVVLGFILSRKGDDSVFYCIVMILCAGFLAASFGGSSRGSEYDLERRRLRELEKVNDRARSKMSLDEQLRSWDFRSGSGYSNTDSLEDIKKKQIRELEDINDRATRKM